MGCGKGLSHVLFNYELLIFMEYDGKRVLLVGSGLDVNGRRLAAAVDGPRSRWDVVVRMNRHYGNPEDVGLRTDVIFTRWKRWLGWWSREALEAVSDVVVLNEYMGFSAEELALDCREVGHDAASIGLHTAAFLVRRGALVEGIGFGCAGGVFAREKRYPDGRRDGNLRYNWRAENEWLRRNITLL